MSNNTTNTPTTFSGRMRRKLVDTIQNKVIDEGVKFAIDLIKSQFVTSTTLDPDGWGVESAIAERVLQWYTTTPYANRAGRFKISGRYNWDFIERKSEDPKAELQKMIGVGPGRHFFMFQGVFGWLDYGDHAKSGGDTGGLVNLSLGREPRYKVTITLLTSNRQLFRDFMNEVIDVTSKLDSGDKVKLKEFNGEDGWRVQSDLQYRSLDTVYIDPEVKARIIKRIEDFYEEEKWHLARGFPYKLVIGLYGPPGNGKTSFVRALAHHFKRNLLDFPISRATDDNFKRALSMVKDEFVLIEDIHSKKSLHRVATKEDETDLGRDISKLSLSGYLNAIDGIATLNGAVIFVTTNYIERLDTAVIRRGRMDIKECIGDMSDTLIRQYIHDMFEGELDHIVEKIDHFPSTAGSNVSCAFLEYHKEPEKFIEVVKEGVYDDYIREETIRENARKLKEEQEAKKSEDEAPKTEPGSDAPVVSEE